VTVIQVAQVIGVCQLVLLKLKFLYSLAVVVVVESLVAVADLVVPFGTPHIQLTLQHQLQ
jgi:hypothetical protein